MIWKESTSDLKKIGNRNQRAFQSRIGGFEMPLCVSEVLQNFVTAYFTLWLSFKTCEFVTFHPILEDLRNGPSNNKKPQHSQQVPNVSFYKFLSMMI